VGELHPRITWQAVAAQQVLVRWDEQPVCRKCSGTTSLTGSPNFIFPTSPEADGHGEFSPQRVQQARWTSAMTNRLLPRSGARHHVLPVGRSRSRPEPHPKPGAGAEPHTDIVPGLVTPMVYRSQSWLNNKTRGSAWNASATYVTGSHSMKFGYPG